MGQVSTYVFPTTTETGFVDRALAALIFAGVVTEVNEFYAPGDIDWALNAFEEVGLHRSLLPYIIPQDPAVFPRCPSCDHDVSDDFYEMANEIEWESNEVDWSQLKVKCPGCGLLSPITELKDPLGIYCATEYIYFSDVTAEDICEFENSLRSILPGVTVKSYGYT